MSQPKHAVNDVFEAIHLFLKELPDPKTTKRPSIMADFLVEDQTVRLEAKKTRGMEGAIWNVDVNTAN